MNKHRQVVVGLVVLLLSTPIRLVMGQEDPLLLGLTTCCPNNLVQYNTETGEIEIIAEVGDGERVVLDIMPEYDNDGNVVGYDTTWTLEGDIFNAATGGSVLDASKESMYVIRNERVLNISLLDGQLTQLASADGIGELVGLERETGRLFARTLCCPSEIIALDPETGERAVIAEVGATFDDVFYPVTGPSLSAEDGSRVFFMRNNHLLLVETANGQLDEGPLIKDTWLVAYDNVSEEVYLQTICCPNKLLKYSLREEHLSEVADIGREGDAFLLSFGWTVYNPLTDEFYLKRNNKLLTVSMTGETYVEEEPSVNALSIVGGLRNATRVGVEEEHLRNASESILSVSPNPFRNQVDVEILSQSNDEIRFEVYDLLGRRLDVLFSGRIPSGEKRMFHLEAKGWPNGLYFLRYATSLQSEVKTIVLSR